MANTTNFAVEKPAVGGYRNSWGGTLNTGLDKLDELLALALPVGTIQLWPKTTAPVATANGGAWLLCNGSELLKTGYSALSSVLAATFGDGPSGSDYFLLPDFRARMPVGYNTDTIAGRSTRAISANGGAETHTLLETELRAHTHGIVDPGHSHDFKMPTHTHSGTTGDTTLSISETPHTHSYTTYGVSGRDTGGTNSANSLFNVGKVTDAASTNATLSPSAHGHSFTAGDNTDADTTYGESDKAVLPLASVGITSQTTGSSAAHNNMQPFMVVNYIILAKHPTF
jgi:microcystin-dependent protein